MKLRNAMTAVGLLVGLAGCSDILDLDPKEPAPENPGGGTGGFGGFRDPPQRLPTEPVRAAKSPPAIAGGTLAIAPGEKFAVAADADRDLVHVISLESNAVRTIDMGEGAEPGRVAIDALGHAHVVLRGSGELAQIDLSAGSLVTKASVCLHPRGVSVNEASASVLVACASGDVVRLDAASYAEQARRFIEHDLRDVVVTRDNRILVSRYRRAEAIEVNASLKQLSRLRPGRRTGVKLSFNPEDGSDMEQAVTMDPTLAWRTVLNQDGEAVMLHQRSQLEEVVPAPGGYGGDGCAGITETTVSVMTEGAEPTPQVALSGQTSGVDVSFSPDGKWLAVASPSAYFNGFQSTVTLYSASEASVPAPNADLMGTCAAAFPITMGELNSQVVAVAFGDKGRLFAFSREPASLDVYAVQTNQEPGADYPGWTTLLLTARTQLSTLSVRDTGHDLFHADVGAGIACVSCHGEALDDGHTWTFEGIGPRRTQTMRGGLSGTEPFHWDGDMQNFGHLVDEVMTGRMGGFQVEDPFKNALKDWIDAQPAVVLAARDATAAERGEKVFKSAACASCHAGAALTNNASMDVGTGGTFQVPSLRGLALRAPYMHDGCAETLADRFKPACGGGDRHGLTSNLTAAQLRDLTAYLETL